MVAPGARPRVRRRTGRTTRRIRSGPPELIGTEHDGIPAGAWAPDGSFAHVTNVDADTLSVIAADDWVVTATIPVGDAPTSVAVLPDGSRGYVTNLHEGTLRVLDLDG